MLPCLLIVVVFRGFRAEARELVWPDQQGSGAPEMEELARALRVKNPEESMFRLTEVSSRPIPPPPAPRPSVTCGVSLLFAAARSCLVSSFFPLACFEGLATCVGVWSGLMWFAPAIKATIHGVRKARS